MSTPRGALQKRVNVGADSHQFEVAALEKAANGSYQGGSPSHRDFSKIRLASVVCAESWASRAIDTGNPRHVAPAGIATAEALGQPAIAHGRKRNEAYRQREHLTEDEVVRLMEAAKDNRYGARDAALIFTMYRHGLRVSEACALDWSAIDFEQKELHVRRSKLGKPATHPIRGDELRALRRLHRDAGQPRHGPVFVTERGTAFTRAGVAKLIGRAGEAAGFGFRVHPHMLRHACGFALAKAGHDTRRLQDYLGHRSINSTVKYTALDSSKFDDFGR